MGTPSVEGSSGISFDLVFSVLCTQNRSGGALRHRYSRFDVMMHSLSSYASLPIRRVYLYIALGPEFAARRSELADRTSELFHGRLLTLQHRRLASQLEWKHEIQRTISLGDDGLDEARLIWCMQNDDHPFVDFDHRVLLQGLALMRADVASRFHSLHPSLARGGPAVRKVW